jgi:Dolichyl-phosphate-mannose-protein mannosyltransferase
MKSTIPKQQSSLLILLVFLAVSSAVRLHLLPVPLERDEGEYAYSGQLILQGTPPFSQSYNMKMPGIYVAYAAILACFGQTSTGIHFGLLVIGVLCSLGLFLIGNRLYNPLAGCVAGAAFASMSLSTSVLGLSANAEYFVVVFALFGIFALLVAIDKKSKGLVLLSGLLFGTCFLMKQHGAAFVVFAFLYLLWQELRRRDRKWKDLASRTSLFCAGVAAPFLVICLWLWSAGVFNSFWFWTFTYAREYVSQIPLRIGILIFRDAISNIISSSPVFWLLALVGLVAIVVTWKRSKDSAFPIAYLVFSFLATCPGFYFREHYFILLLPAVCLLSGIGVSAVASLAARWPAVQTVLSLVLVTAAFVATPLIEGAVLFEAPPLRVSRLIYGPNPFPESCTIADSLKAWSSPSDKIGILGSEPQIFFYAHRRSASGYIYTYALMEKHPFALQMQKEMIRQIEAAAPRYLVYVNVEVSWLMRRDSYSAIFEWFNRYQRKWYDIAGVADIISANRTVYVWGDEARKYSLQSSSWVAVFRRKTSDR